MDGDRLIDRPLLQRIFDCEAHYHALSAAERFERAGAVFLRDARVPKIYDQNHARLVRAGGEGAEALLEAVREELIARGHRGSIRLDPLSTPPALEARLALDGWELEAGVLMTLHGEVRGRAAPLPIEPVTSDADWAAFLALRLTDERAAWIRQVGDAWVGYVRRKTPALRMWLARDGGEPVGFFSELAHDGLGLLEDLYVHPGARGRGIGTALVAHCAREARRRGAGLVFLTARADDTPKRMYAKQGFVPVAVTRSYLSPEMR